MKIFKKLLNIFYKNKIIIFSLVGVLSTFNAPFLFLQDFNDLKLFTIFVIYQYTLPLIIFLLLIFYIYKLNYLKNLFLDKKYFILKFLFLLNFLQIFGVFFYDYNYFIPIAENSSQPLTEILLDWKSTYTRIIFIINNFNIILIGFLCIKNKTLKFYLYFFISYIHSKLKKI